MYIENSIGVLDLKLEIPTSRLIFFDPHNYFLSNWSLGIRFQASKTSVVTFLPIESRS